MNLKEKIKKHFDTSYFHLTLKTREDVIDELCEMVYLFYKGLGFLIGIFSMSMPLYSWIWVICLILWLMFDIRLTKKKKKLKIEGMET